MGMLVIGVYITDILSSNRFFHVTSVLVNGYSKRSNHILLPVQVGVLAVK
jgi:hypothetical protein